MTAAERETHFRKLRRALRDDQVRRGSRAPRTMREMEIWREGDAERERWRAEQIAEAERRQEQRAARAKRGTGSELGQHFSGHAWDN
jgi:hypothetical protein